MTSKEYRTIREFYGKHSNLRMYGHVWLFPKAGKHMKRSTNRTFPWECKNEVMYIRPRMMRVDGDELRIFCPEHGLFTIHHRWVKGLQLYHYNY